MPENEKKPAKNRNGRPPVPERRRQPGTGGQQLPNWRRPPGQPYLAPGKEEG